MQGANLARAGAIGSPCCYRWETHMLRELGERLQCRHEVSSCPRASVQAIFTKCHPSDTLEHCSRTCHRLSGPRGMKEGRKYFI